MSLNTCPFCNAPLPSHSSPPSVEKLLCPRCNEWVATSRFPIGAAAATASAAIRDVDKRRTLAIIVGGMAFIAIVSLVFALMTTKIRRDNDFKAKIPKKSDETHIARQLLAPSDLSGLGYLPKETSIALGLHVALLLDEPVGKELLKEPRPKLLQMLLSPLEKADIALGDVEHVVIGVSLPGKLPQVTGIVVTRQPYDLAKLEQALKPVQPVKYRQGTLYRMPTPPFGSAKLWTVDRRVLIFTWSLAAEKTEDVDRVSSDPQSGLDHLTPMARKLLMERLNKQSRAWVVGDLGEAAPLVDLLGPFAPKEVNQPLSLIKAFAIGISTSDDVTLLGDFFTGDAQAAGKLEQQLAATKIEGAKSQKVEGPPPGVTDADAQWVTWQVRMEAAVLRQRLDQAKK